MNLSIFNLFHLRQIVCSAYSIKELVEITNTPLELLGLREIKCFLEESVSISIEFTLDSASLLFLFFLEVVRYNLFTNSLMGAIIQDSSKKERSNDVTFIILLIYF